MWTAPSRLYADLAAAQLIVMPPPLFGTHSNFQRDSVNGTDEGGAERGFAPSILISPRRLCALPYAQPLVVEPPLPAEGPRAAVYAGSGGIVWDVSLAAAVIRVETAVTTCAGANGLTTSWLSGTPLADHSAPLSPVI